MQDVITADQNQLLLIDDDPNLILLVKDYLELRGYEVTTAKNGREALRVLEKSIPNLIICDVMMPEMDGYAFVKRVRDNPQTSYLPVLFLSAKGQIQDRVTGLNTGADVYMIKPFEPDELVAQIEASLKQASRMMQKQANSLEGELSVQVPFDVDLTPTETKVIQLVAKGMSNREIADDLSVSQRTVESHVSNMLGKTGLNNRTELARWAIEQRMV
ncbi:MULTISPECIES: response regulator transcription factor [Acaryochloris]|uniref:Two component transcriptional regulator, LuxR family n=1 Tax=Acaryochloris marina (strain MBIC 11017) TaxID=329726 RepID=B0CDA3_ACAM1|nr:MULTISPECIES: response regulator transcription factor [Acaryochloris]ABW26828.1 two component transcriptional regulator, LuxR family [Acaryochloris marina MBIC11017]KAI9131513.1 response regulator transcription factor [Acaryochloris sp. CCMEE 5410]